VAAVFVPHLSPVAVVLSANKTCVSSPTGSLVLVELNVNRITTNEKLTKAGIFVEENTGFAQRP
jgi:hypothetical protein